MILLCPEENRSVWVGTPEGSHSVDKCTVPGTKGQIFECHALIKKKLMYHLLVIKYCQLFQSLFFPNYMTFSFHPTTRPLIHCATHPLSR